MTAADVLSLLERVCSAGMAALAVLFPIECAGCGALDLTLCEACRRECSARVSVHTVSDGSAPSDLVIFAALPYEGAQRRCILSLKEHGRTDIAGVLGDALAVAIDSAAVTCLEAGAGTGLVEIVHVPSSRSARRRRGYDPVRLLVRHAGFVVSDIFMSPNTGSVQKGLTVLERSRNRRGAFVTRGQVDSRRFIIVDDVATTGATLLDASRAIREAGGEVIATAVLAFTPRRDRSRAH